MKFKHLNEGYTLNEVIRDQIVDISKNSDKPIEVDIYQVPYVIDSVIVVNSTMKETYVGQGVILDCVRETNKNHKKVSLDNFYRNKSIYYTPNNDLTSIINWCEGRQSTLESKKEVVVDTEIQQRKEKWKAHLDTLISNGLVDLSDMPELDSIKTRDDIDDLRHYVNKKEAEEKVVRERREAQLKARNRFDDTDFETVFIGLDDDEEVELVDWLKQHKVVIRGAAPDIYKNSEKLQGLAGYPNGIHFTDTSDNPDSKWGLSLGLYLGRLESNDVPPCLPIINGRTYYFRSNEIIYSVDFCMKLIEKYGFKLGINNPN